MQIYTALFKVEHPIKIKTCNFGGSIPTMIITFDKDFVSLNALLQRIPMEAAMEITLVKEFTSFPHLF